jgi:hypothetical protein
MQFPPFVDLGVLTRIGIKLYQVIKDQIIRTRLLGRSHNLRSSG